MSEARNSGEMDLASLLSLVRNSKAHASLRPEGSVRMLGELQVQGLEPGKALHLAGAKRRDQIPPEGTPVTLSIILGEEVLTLRSCLLEPIISAEGDTLFPPVLRLAWPQEALVAHRRKDVRVANSDMPSLDAMLLAGERRLEAQLLNLTETGVGLGLADSVPMEIGSRVTVETVLPGGIPFRSPGEVRHVEALREDPLPMRVGLVLCDVPRKAQEALHRFIQARRTDRSESRRQAAPSFRAEKR